MKNYQKWVLKLVALGVIFLASPNTHAQNPQFGYRLQTADSLYSKKQFTQSLKLYQQIFEGGASTPAMLLKMAYIEEGLGNTALALYYISAYHKSTGDPAALTKMEEMATKYRLSGYDLNPNPPLEFFLKYKVEFLTVASALAILLLAIMIFTVRQHGRRPYVSLSFFVLVVATIVVGANWNFQPVNGITLHAPAYLMSGPSPGANVVGVVTEGNRLAVTGHHDAWVRVSWKGDEAWVRENQVLVVR